MTEQLRDGELSQVQTWEGSLTQVQEKFLAEQNNWQSASAQRNGPNVVLTLERTFPAPPEYPQDRGEEKTVEVIWREVMLPLRQAPGLLAGIEAGTISPGILDEIDLEKGRGGMSEWTEDDNPLYIEYVRLLAKGITEFPSAVPVVRQTTSRQNSSQNQLGLGEAYVRDSPPVDVPGGWEWLKTSDERRRDGRTYTKVEEWTGGKELSTLIYPE